MHTAPPEQQQRQPPPPPPLHLVLLLLYSLRVRWLGRPSCAARPGRAIRRGPNFVFSFTHLESLTPPNHDERLPRGGGGGGPAPSSPVIKFLSSPSLNKSLERHEWCASCAFAAAGTASPACSPAHICSTHGRRRRRATIDHTQLGPAEAAAARAAILITTEQMVVIKMAPPPRSCSCRGPVGCNSARKPDQFSTLRAPYCADPRFGRRKLSPGKSLTSAPVALTLLARSHSTLSRTVSRSQTSGRSWPAPLDRLRARPTPPAAAT